MPAEDRAKTDEIWNLVVYLGRSRKSKAEYAEKDSRVS